MRWKTGESNSGLPEKLFVPVSFDSDLPSSGPAFWSSKSGMVFSLARRFSKLDVDREYCLNDFDNYSQTAEPGFLANYYAYYCDHYIKGEEWTQNPEENAPLG